MADEERQMPAHSVEQLTQMLQPFLEANPGTEVARSDTPSLIYNQLLNPWGDPTLTFIFDDDPAEAIAAFNSIILPGRFSAIWHQDSHDLEVIWTAYDLSADQREVENRAFNFTFNKKKYKCEFGESSQRLLTIAKGMIPRSGPSSTSFRNMTSFYQYVTADENDDKEAMGLSRPRSFWIRKLKLSEATAVEFATHLNFYLSYYDTQSPTILVHFSNLDSKFAPRDRYVAGGFPKDIVSRKLDENMITFWNAACSGNNMLRFIFYYRIIEYGAFHHLDSAIKLKLRRILANPAMCLDIDKTLETVLSILDTKKPDDVPRFNSLLSTVDASKVWHEIEKNRLSFTHPVKFDGGFTIEPIISKDEKWSTFSTAGMVKFADAVRKIRNVLSHGRDQNTSTAITPTARNLMNLAPWVSAISAAAGEVVLYEGVS